MKRFFKYAYVFFLHGFALVGIFLIGGFFAIRLHLTDVKGMVDQNNQDFKKTVLGAETEKKSTNPSQNTIIGTTVDLDQKIQQLSKIKEQKILNICKLDAIGKYAPLNAKNILAAYEMTKSDAVVSKMIFAAMLRLRETGKNSELDACGANAGADYSSMEYASLEEKYQGAIGDNLFPWMNDEEWASIKEAIAKDKDQIDRASEIAQIEPRLVVASAIVEQVRLFHSQRELFKKFFEPLKILGNSNKISWGIMGVKEQTAIETENHLKDQSSSYYLGESLQNALDFSSENQAEERYNRLTDEKDHFYSYLYGSIYMKEMMQQWKNAGYDISYRPEIIGTLFNVGFPQSKPNPDPKVGGSEISVGEVKYSFGSLAYEFYYSGELIREFPFVIN